MISTLTRMARLLRRTLEGMATPCSVKSYGAVRRSPPQLEITNCDFKCSNWGLGGEGGIRTHDTLARIPVFETGTFNRSVTSPVGRILPARRINAPVRWP